MRQLRPREPTNAPPAERIDASAPAESLALRWAYGFRGFDTRRAALWAGGGKIVYPAAAVVVVYDVGSHKQVPEMQMEGGESSAYVDESSG